MFEMQEIFYCLVPFSLGAILTWFWGWFTTISERFSKLINKGCLEGHDQQKEHLLGWLAQVDEKSAPE